MPIDQSQVDQILAGASDSGEDTETRLHNLEQEVDYIKTSIKRLPIDIRERMNEMENPFSIEVEDMAEQIKEEVIDQIKKSKIKISGNPEPEEGEKEKEREDEPQRYQRQPDYGPQGVQLHVAPPQYPPGILQVGPYQPQYAQPYPQPGYQVPPQPAAPPAPAPAQKESLIDEAILKLLSEQSKQRETEVPQSREPVLPVPAPPTRARNEKIELQKVQKLFEWTGKAVKKYGHDRLELMLDSYQALGYISEDAVEQVREITRLMPPSLGIEHEIDSNDFVSEIYALKIILEPEDKSLDRDMIEMLMSGTGAAGTPPSNAISPPAKARSRRASRENDESQEWIDMLDRI